MSKGVGIYLHVPFCGKKCPYCDFYSGAASVSNMDAYTEHLCRQLLSYADKEIPAETLYFGGGTPNLLGGARLSRILTAAKQAFSLKDTAEITVEANPATVTADFLQTIRKAGANRLSLGMQSAHPEELRFLGRRHTPEQVETVVNLAREAGFANLSLDLMLGIPGQSAESLQSSIAFCSALGVEHVSAYLLKIEDGTPYAAQRDSLSLPSEDTVSDWYLLAVEELAKQGFAQYEISNFAKAGYEGQHNLLYWQCREYLGFGPSAHSFYQGKRFYYPRSLEAYLQGNPPIPDGSGGDREEFAMLALRLTRGLSGAIWQERFHEPIPSALLQKARRFVPAGLVAFSGEDAFHLTPAGFLVSNALLSQLLC